MNNNTVGTSIPLLNDKAAGFVKKNLVPYGTGLVTPTLASAASYVVSAAWSGGYLPYLIGCPTTAVAVGGIGYLFRQLGKRPAFKDHGRNLLHQLKSSPGIQDSTRIALDTIKPALIGKTAIKMETEARKNGSNEKPSSIEVLRRLNPDLANILETETSSTYSLLQP
jgi:hypothetical protein